MVSALLKEIDLKPEFFHLPAGEGIETIYFGGGTPSLLAPGEISSLIGSIRKAYPVSPVAEITLEANPDDLGSDQLKGWKEAGINRLSIGVQSFFEEDLRWMNRAHTAIQAKENLELALRFFENMTIDLIYGTPGLNHQKWEQNVQQAIRLGIPHLSCYALTVEPKTPLDKMIRQHKKENVNPDMQAEQFLLLMEWMENAGYEHYEISNFAKPGYRSRHNSSYWRGKSYLGIGPSAHSFNGISRWWNIANNAKYMQSIQEGIIPYEKEELSPVQRINESIMINLRTIEGLDLSKFEESTRQKIEKESNTHLQAGMMIREKDFLQLTRQGKFLADGIAADLFLSEGDD